MPHSGRRSMPSLRSAGSMIRHCTTTPAVVPRPSSSTCGLLIDVGAAGFSCPGSAIYATSTPMETMLFATGAQAPGRKCSFVFRMAMNRENMP